MTNAIGGNVIPFQANDGQEAAAEIKTDKFGKATFTITGTNATVTPIVFLDGSNQYWNTEGGSPNSILIKHIKTIVSIKKLNYMLKLQL